MVDLEAMFAHQLNLQRKSFGVDPDALPLPEKIAYIKEMAYACEDEIHEAVSEISWKSWQDAEYINRDAYLKELSDVTHFLINLCLATGITAQELFNAYFTKAKVNARRQEEGYDGVTDKCVNCRRSFDDVGRSETYQSFCSPCGHTLQESVNA